MKTVFAIAASALALAATPALADAPAGPRVEVLAGYDKVSADLGGGVSMSRDGFNYGLNLGYDLAVSQSLSAGIDAEIADSTAKLTVGTTTVKAARDLYIGGRLSVAVTPAVNVYGKVGYTNARLTAEDATTKDGENFDGVRFGIGAQANLSSNVYGLVEYRYSNYEQGGSRNQVLAGVGARF